MLTETSFLFELQGDYEKFARENQIPTLGLCLGLGRDADVNVRIGIVIVIGIGFVIVGPHRTVVILVIRQ